MLIARSLDEPLQLVGVLRAALARLLRGDLERDREELLLVAVNVRIEEREKMLRRHTRPPFSTRRLGYIRQVQ